ncbi:MAG: hypothetical protein GWO24_05955, partial [Akkermansiaceae bacterium]|nr:hypothetical protein [Akkermansiaceae bacterium]
MPVVFAALVASSEGAITYIGDGAAEEQDVTAGTAGPDGANGGNITYAFF